MRTPQRLRAALVIAAMAATALASQAQADTPPPTSGATVTVAVASGARSLQLTGVDGGNVPVPSTATSLAFNDTTTASRFGVIVTDLAHERIGYTVDSVLSNLHKLDDCSSSAIASSAFSISFPDAVQPVADVEALVSSVVDFSDTDIVEDVSAVDATLGSTLSTALGLLGQTELPVDVNDVVGSPSSWATSALELMTPANGTVPPDAFTSAATHPTCTSGDDDTATSVQLQNGATNDPSATDLLNAVFATVAADGTLSSVEATTPNGSGQTFVDETDLEDQTLAAVTAALSGLISPTAAQLDAITANVVADLTAASTDVVLSLLGQSGVYANAPELALDPAGTDGLATGLYSGRMTVTLTDQ